MSNLVIKICGLTSREAVAAGLSLGQTKHGSLGSNSGSAAHVTSVWDYIESYHRHSDVFSNPFYVPQPQEAVRDVT